MNFTKSSGLNYFLGRLHSYAWNSQNHFIIRRIDIHRKKMRISKRPTQFRVDLGIQIRIRIIQDFVNFKSIKTQQPIGLIQSIFTHQRGVRSHHRHIGIITNRNIARIINPFQIEAFVISISRVHNFLV